MDMSLQIKCVRYAAYVVTHYGVIVRRYCTTVWP